MSKMLSQKFFSNIQDHGAWFEDGLCPVLLDAGACGGIGCTGEYVA